MVSLKALNDRVEQSHSLSPHGDTHVEQMLAQLAPCLSAQMSRPQKGLSQAPYSNALPLILRVSMINFKVFCLHICSLDYCLL